MLHIQSNSVGNQPLLHQAKLHCFVKGVSSKLSIIKTYNCTVSANFLELFKLQKAAAVCIIEVKCESSSFLPSKRIENVNCLRVSSCGAQEKLLKIQLVIAITVDGVEKRHQIRSSARFIVLHQSCEVLKGKKVGLIANIARLCGKSIKSPAALCLFSTSCGAQPEREQVREQVKTSDV